MAPRALAWPFLLLLIAACGTTTPAATPRSAAGSPSADAGGAEPIPIELGRLAPGTRYLLETDPVISVQPETEWGAGPAPGGIALISGQTTVRILTGVDEVYVERGRTEPAAEDAAGILEQIARNDRLTVTGDGEASLGGQSAAYVDAEAIVDPIEAEGGTLVLQVSGESVRLADHFVNRVMVVSGDAGLFAVIVSAPEAGGLEQTLVEVADLLASIRVED